MLRYFDLSRSMYFDAQSSSHEHIYFRERSHDCAAKKYFHDIGGFILPPMAIILRFLWLFDYWF